jgi:hypothetical protein
LRAIQPLDSILLGRDRLGAMKMPAISGICRSARPFVPKSILTNVRMSLHVHRACHALGSPWQAPAPKPESPPGRFQPIGLEPVMNFPAGGAGSQFFSVRGARSDEYGLSSSDKRRRNEENWPQPSGLRRKSGHTSFSSSTVDPPQPSDSASSPPHGRRPVRGGPGLARFSSATPPTRKFITGSRILRPVCQIRGTLYSIVEFDLKFLPVPVTAYSQTSTLRSR